MHDTILFLGGILFIVFGVVAMGLYFAWRERHPK
jgi:heme/copper-type cytochrome/quinol oxidase subunit 2